MWQSLQGHTTARKQARRLSVPFTEHARNYPKGCCPSSAESGTQQVLCDLASNTKRRCLVPAQLLNSHQYALHRQQGTSPPTASANSHDTVCHSCFIQPKTPAASSAVSLPLVCCTRPPTQLAPSVAAKMSLSVACGSPHTLPRSASPTAVSSSEAGHPLPTAVQSSPKFLEQHMIRMVRACQGHKYRS